MVSKHKKELQKNKKKEIVELKKVGKWEPSIEKKPVKRAKQVNFIQALQNKANQQTGLTKNSKIKLPVGRYFAQILAIIFVLSLVLASLAPLLR